MKYICLNCGEQFDEPLKSATYGDEKLTSKCPYCISNKIESLENVYIKNKKEIKTEGGE